MKKSLLSASMAIMLAGTALADDDKKPLDPNVPEDAVRILQKQICSLNEGEVVIYYWEGSMFSRVEGERDRVLFKLQGMNIRHCQNHEHPERGHGFHAVTREIMIHIDPETGEIADTWENPWTGEELEVFHVANDPVRMEKPIYAILPNGKGLKTDHVVVNGRAISTGNAPLFYENPLGGDYQDWVGGKYHAMEMGNDFLYADELFDRDLPTVKRHTISWSRISGWLPWMKMGDRNGVVFTATVGTRLNSLDDLPDPIKTILHERYPKYTAPPPLDDDRPKETSWEVFRKHMEAKRAAEKGDK